MKTGWGHRLRAVLALAIFATSVGGTQLLDALLFHRGPMRPDVVRISAPDRCHSENCELGAPMATSPPAQSRLAAPRFELPHRAAVALLPDDAPRAIAAPGPLGSRAPPALA
ncbi:MAG: hypothetical protein ACREL5_02755 [Gemmatimonadales bacterium]